MGSRLHGMARRAEQIELNRRSCAEMYARVLGPLRVRGSDGHWASEEDGFELPVPLARMSSILRGGEEAEVDRGGLETRHPLSTGMIGSNRWHRLPDAGRRAGRGADRLDSQLRALSP